MTENFYKNCVSKHFIRARAILSSQGKDASSGKVQIRAFDRIKPNVKQPVYDS